MKSQNTLKRIRLSKIGTVVLGAIAVAGVVTTLAVLPGLASAIAPFVKMKKYSTQRALKRNLESLIASGLVKRAINKDGSERIELTKMGRWEAMLNHGTYVHKHEWDQLWRVIIFDVPNAKTHLRNELRRAVRKFGFKLLQKSVWVYPYECDDFIVLLKSHLGVSHDVLYMKVKYIENDKFLKKEFSLK